jgi:hypothetical protein
VSAQTRRLPSSLATNPWADRIAQRRAQGRELIDLTVSNPTLVGLSAATPEILQTLADPRAAVDRPDPRGLASAREAVASSYAPRGVTIDPDQVVLTTGTSESYAHLFRLLTNPGDVVLIPAPSYPLIEPIARLEGLEVVSYRLAWDGAWHLDLGALDGALDQAGERARALVTIEPNHPTGTCLSATEREALEARLEARALALISDEVFAEFPWAPRTASFESWLGPRRVPTFALGGLSKSCGLPQLKLGWIAASGPDATAGPLLEGLEHIADLFLTVGAPVQHALPSLIQGRAAYQARVRARIEENRQALAAFTREHREAATLDGQGGWTSILRLPDALVDDWSLVLLERDVVVHPGHFYDLEPRGAVVVSLIPDAAAFRAGLGRIGEVLATA